MSEQENPVTVKSHDLKAEKGVLAFAIEGAGITARAYEDEIDRLTRPITMQDVRLGVGEGELSPADVLAGVNAELRRRAPGRKEPT